MAVKLECAQCGAWFEQTFRNKNKYCNSQCYGDSLRRLLPGRDCERCGTQFRPNTKKQRFCSRGCSAQHNNPPKRNAMSRPKREGIRVNARKVYEKSGLPMVCCVCGYGRGLDICHIKAVSEFPDDTPTSVINDIDNLVVMDKLCHWEYDNGFLLIDWE